MERGTNTLSYRINSSGVSTIDNATTRLMRSFTAFGKTWFCFAMDSSTKPNSPACAKLKPNSLAANGGRRNSLPKHHRITPFTNSKPSVMPMIGKNWFFSRVKFMPAPTVIKNSPKNKPLNGSKWLSIS